VQCSQRRQFHVKLPPALPFSTRIASHSTGPAGTQPRPRPRPRPSGGCTARAQRNATQRRPAWPVRRLRRAPRAVHEFGIRACTSCCTRTGFVRYAARIPGQPRVQLGNLGEPWWSGPTHPPLISLERARRGALPRCQGLASQRKGRHWQKGRSVRGKPHHSRPAPARRPFKPPAPIPPHTHTPSSLLPHSPPPSLIERAPFHPPISTWPAAVSPAEFGAFLFLFRRRRGRGFRRSRLLRAPFPLPQFPSSPPVILAAS
jgi:hypothetical protein